MERQWYAEDAANAAAATQFQYQQAAAAAHQAAQQQEAYQAAAQQAAYLQAQAQAVAAEAAAQHVAFQQAQAAAAAASHASSQEQAAQQQTWQQQQLFDLQRMQATQARRQQVPGSDGAADRTNNALDIEEEEEQVLPIFTPVTVGNGPALRGFRATSEANRQATDAPTVGFPMAQEDKKQD